MERATPPADGSDILHRAGRARRPGAPRDVGDSLLEVLLTVVITGVTVSALLFSLANAGEAANAQRGLVVADVVMRNYAEAAKAAARTCHAGSDLDVEFAQLDGYPAKIVDPPTAPACPGLTPSVLTLQVNGPRGIRQTMQIEVRSP